jgi:NAD(P)-dependent dehydrogenase (short-subunit alcohol dehydrogenase family)
MATSDGSTGVPALAGDRALVTGGSGGLGRGICEVLAREGARVAFTYSADAAGAEATLAALRARGCDGLAVQLDVRDAAACERAVGQVGETFGGLDILVNNAGVSESVPFILLEDDDIADVVAINALAPMRLARLAARPMLRQKHGRIVNVSSIAGSRSIPGPVHYAASKGALDGMTRSLAHELGPYGILVNGIAAGIFEGGLKHTIPEHHQKRYLDACALKRFGRPEECGELVAWLASRKNTYVNGTVIVQDGGTLA